MNRNRWGNSVPEIRDNGGKPVVLNIDRLTKQNSNYRTALWTGNYLQVTLMSIPVRGEVGLEKHPDTDQFIRVERGRALVMMGESKSNLNRRSRADQNDAILIPAGTWHNIVNAGNTPLKLYSIYAPPHHPFGTVQKTKADADRAERTGNFGY